jgi:single-stranded-DNA-specific exonuclease
MTISSAPRHEWVLQEPDAASHEALAASELGRMLGPLAVRLLALRGQIKEDGARNFLEPRLADLGDPFMLPDMKEAVARLFEAIERKEKVTLYGDYDVDGVTSLTLITLILRAYGLDPHCFLPHRVEEGYGLSGDGLARCFPYPSVCDLEAVRLDEMVDDPLGEIRRRPARQTVASLRHRHRDA